MELTGDLFEVVVDRMPEGVILVDREARITYWNRGAKRLTGYGPAEMIGKVHPVDALTLLDSSGSPIKDNDEDIAAAIESGEITEKTVYIENKNGQRIPVRIHIGPLRDAQGHIVGAVETLADNTRLAAAAQRIEELETLTLIDPLTKLPNRVYIEMTLLARLNEMRRYGWTFGVLFMDVDSFKEINDTYGHETGDEVLKSVGKGLPSDTRPFDVMGRWGGDEFVGVIVYATEAHLKAIAERFRRIVEEIVIPGDDGNVRVTLSIGATLARKDDNVESLFKRADRLMYQSKNSGRNRISVETEDNRDS